MHRETVSPLFRFDTMTPLIDQQPYVRALEELVAAAKLGSFGDSRLTPAEAWGALMNGECAMALTWALAGGEVANSSAKIAFAPMPGSNQTYRLATKSWENRGE